MHAVFNIASADPRGEFRSQREVRFVAIRSDFRADFVEFLLDDVRVIADATLEHAAILEDRRLHPFVARLSGAMTHGLLDVGVVLLIFWKKIMRAFGRTELSVGHRKSRACDKQ